MVSEVVKQFAWAAYDNLGGLIAVNLIWALICLPWLGVSGLVVAWGTGPGGGWAPAAAVASVLAAAELVIFSPPSVLLFLAANRWSRGQTAEIWPLLRELPRYFARRESSS